MDKQLKRAANWGLLLWLIGWILGIILFMVVPKNLIGWILNPVGIVITLWVLLKKFKGEAFAEYLQLSIVWTLIAIVFDYAFNVQLFKLGSAYYQPDIFFYYAATFLLPLFVYHYRISTKNKK
jgi:hypothetical protein